MNTSNFTLSLQSCFSKEDWQVLVLALRQDATIWKCLESTDLGLRALEELPHRLESWTPGSLALLDLRSSMDIAALQSVPPQPVPATLRQLSNRALQEWPQLDLANLNRIGQAGLVAIALRERNISDSWQSFSSDFQVILGTNSRGWQSGGTVLACLLSMVPDPDVVLSALLTDEKSQKNLARLAVISLHALLCLPMPEQELHEKLALLLRQLPFQTRLAGFEYLSRQRPGLVERILSTTANQNLGRNESPALFPNEQKEAGTAWTKALAEMDHLRSEANINWFRGETAKTVDTLQNALDAARSAQAQLAAKLAAVCSELEDYQGAFTAWKQACQLVPDSPRYWAELAFSMIQAGRLEDAQALLEAKNGDLSSTGHALYWLSRALIAFHQGDFEISTQAALQALNQTEEQARSMKDPNPISTGPADTPYFELSALQLAQLSSLLNMLDQPGPALQAARLGMLQKPNDPLLLEAAGKASLKQGSAQQAIPLAAAANTLWPDNMNLARLYIESLEAAGEWQAALAQRMALMDRFQTEDTTSIGDMKDLAACALKAGQPELAAETCHQALQFAPDDGEIFHLLGEASLAVGDTDKGLEYFQQAVRSTPTLACAWLAQAHIYQEAGDTPKAMEVLRTASLAAPEAPEIHLALGEAYLAENAPTQALFSLRSAASLVFPKSGEPPCKNKNGLSELDQRIALKLGQTLHHLGHLAEAREVLEKAYRAFPSGKKCCPQLAYAYAKTLLEQNELELAVAPLDDYIQSEPQDPLPYLEYARVLLALPQLSASQSQKAIALLERVIRMDHKRPEAQALLAEALAATGDLPKAREAYRRALETSLCEDPNWRTRLSAGLGKVALAMGQYETAIAALQEAAQIDSLNPAIHMDLAEAYSASQLSEDSLQAAHNVLRLNPDDVDTLSWFSQHLYKLSDSLGDYQFEARKEAFQALQRAVHLAPHRGDLLVRLAQVNLDSGRPSDALDTLLKMVPEPARDGSGWISDVQASPQDLLQAARQLASLHEFEMASRVLERAVAIQQSSGEPCGERDSVCVDLLSELAYTQQQAGNPTRALEAVNQALAIEPETPYLYLQRANLLVDLQSPQTALETLQAALDLPALNNEVSEHDLPVLVAIHQQFALLLRSLGRPAEALKYAEKAMELEGDAPGRGRHLAAEILTALLQPRRAAELLAGQDENLENAWAPFQYACLIAETALAAGDEERATRAAGEAAQINAGHPQVLAIQAQLLARQGDSAAALNTLQKAVNAAENLPQIPETAGTDPASSVLPVNAALDLITRSLPAWRAIGMAALELHDWDTAINCFCRICAAAPDEPLSHLLYARALALRAEAQRLLQAVDVVRHAPGIAALGEEHFINFQSAVERARQLLGTPDKDSQALLAALEARGKAAFCSNLQSAEELKETAAGPDDTAALILNYRTVEQPILAAEAAQTYPNEPRILLALSLAMEKANARYALGVAASAVERYADLKPAAGDEAALANALLARLAYEYGSRSTDRISAQDAIRAALDYWPDEPRWHILAARIHLPEDPQAAIEHYRKAVQLEPENLDTYFALSEIYEQNQEWDQAIKVLEQAGQIAPENEDVWMTLAGLQLQVGDLENAANNADRAIELSDHTPETLLLRARVALEANSPRGAQSRAQAVLRLFPNNLEALQIMAQALKALDQPAEALTWIEKSIPLVDDPLPLLIERVRLIKAAQGLEASARALQELAQQYPGDAEVLAMLAETQFEQGQIDAGLQTARQALQGSKGSLEPHMEALLHYLLGSQLRRAGQLDQAVHHLSEALQLDPDRFEAYMELGQTQRDRRQLAQALQVYQQAIDLFPYDPRPYHQAGVTLKEMKDYLAAESMLRRAADLAPDDVTIHRLLGAVVALNLVHNRRPAAEKQA